MNTVKADWADQQHRAYLLSSLFVLSIIVMFAGSLAWIWASDEARLGTWTSGFVLITTATAVLGVVATTAWLAVDIARHQLALRWKRHVVLACVLTDAAVWGLIAGSVLTVLATMYAHAIVFQPPASRTLTYWRMTTFSNGVSMVVPLVLLLASLDVWAIWNVRRLKMQTYDRAQSFVFHELLTGRDPNYRPLGRNAFRERLRPTLVEVAPWGRLRSWWGLLPGALAFSLVLLGDGLFTTVDGLEATRLLWCASLAALVLGAEALARSAHQGFVLIEALRRLRVHPIAGAFGRVADRPMIWTLGLSPLRRMAIAPLIADIRVLQARLPTCGPAQSAFEALDAAGSITDGDPSTPIMATNHWLAISRVLEVLYRIISVTRWRPDATLAHDDRLRQAEDVVAYAIVFVIRNILARVISGLTAGLAAIALVGLAHLFYPFQGRHFWLVADAVCFVTAAAIACTVLIRFERDRILSTLWSTTPDRINWTGGFFYHIAVTAAVPLILILASLFPEIGGSLAALAEPIRHALP